MRSPFSPAISELGEDFKDDTSLNSKSIGESSITTSTKVPGNDDFTHKHEIKVIDSLNINTFVKLSDFSDCLGRKLIFTVDWQYENRLWKDSHVYIKDIMLETILAMSLRDDIVNPNDQDFSVTKTQCMISQVLGKLLSGHNIRKNILDSNFSN